MTKKTFRKALSVLCVLALIISMSAAVFAEDVNGVVPEEPENLVSQPESADVAPTDNLSYTVDTPYSYPIVPGTAEWNSLTSLKEKIEVCSVDEELMKSMTTPALLETVINYPLLINMYAFNSIEQGYASVSEYFKGIDILLAREDALVCIQSALQATTYSEDDTAAILKKGDLETLARLLNDKQNSPCFSTPGGSTLEVIYDLTWDDHPITEEDAYARNVKYTKTYPHATLVSGINPSYNCHSYAWYSTSTSNNCWIQDPTPYMTDGSYSKQPSASEGYKAVWPGNYLQPSTALRKSW